jgi:hypothetical protein
MKQARRKQTEIPQEEKDRRDKKQIYTLVILHGMITSAPICDRTKVNKRAWVRLAAQWADEVLLVK